MAPDRFPRMGLFSWRGVGLLLPTLLGILVPAGAAWSAPQEADPAADAPQQVDVYTSGTEGYHTYRIPGIVLTKTGTLLAFCEGRKTGSGDQGDIDLVLRRSTDGGKTWGPMQLVHEEGGTAKVTIGNPCPVVDRQTGTIWLPFCRNNDRVFVTRSTDDGKTWAAPSEITASVKPPGWAWYATGPGHGIQLVSGRLLVPCDHSVGGEPGWDKQGFSHTFYSDDHGATWKLGGSTEMKMDECEAVELADGSVLLSMRNYIKPNQRAFATSRDGGLSWSKPQKHPQVHCPVCQASIQRYSLRPDLTGIRRYTTRPPRPVLERILYSGPGGPGRTHLTVRLSYDEGKSWPVAKVLYPGPSAYSDLVVLPNGTIGCLYERGAKRAYEKISFGRFTLAWLTDGAER